MGFSRTLTIEAAAVTPEDPVAVARSGTTTRVRVHPGIPARVFAQFVFELLEYEEVALWCGALGVDPRDPLAELDPGQPVTPEAVPVSLRP